MTTSEAPPLRQTLRGYQIFFIVLSAVIGGGIFNNDGEALELAGPAGLILAVVIIGIITIAVGECVSEFTQQFATPNAIVEYVSTFVDKDLGWVIGLAYWYSFASIFALETLAAAGLSNYWGLSQTFQVLAFYVASPALILILNFLGVFYYGIVETVGGALKVVLVLGVSIVLYTIAAKEGKASSDGPINDGFQNNIHFATNPARAVCYAIPLIAFTFYGVEVVAVTAYEAQYATSLQWPSRLTSYTIFLLYLLCTIGQVVTVRWTDPYLPEIFGGDLNGTTTHNSTMGPPRSVSLVINATLGAGYYNLAGFLNGCFIFSVLSTSNTTLYVASRTLYGLARQLPTTSRIGRKLNQSLSIVVPQTGVPAAALLFSSVSFFWLPFLQIQRGYAIEDLIEIMSVSASISCLIAWSALCLAFIRYEWWLKICDDSLQTNEALAKYRRKSTSYKPFTFFSWLQPWVAWFGLIGCLLVFAFASATWWSSHADFTKVAAAYAAHILLFILFIILKIVNKRWWVELTRDVTALEAKLNRLEYLKQERPQVATVGSPPIELHSMGGEPTTNHH